MKTVLITGAASGIGRATAELFYQSGWRVGLFDISETQLVTLSQQWDPDRYRIQVADVTNAEQIGAAIDVFVASVGQLDVLFNCAGVLEIGDFETIPLQRHHRILAINNTGLLNCCYCAFPHLQRNPGARVINMSSASSLYGVPGFASYSASKFWVKGFTEALSTEWSRHGIHVMDIEPPFVKTPMLAGKQAKIIERMGVNLTAEDIAAAVLAAAGDTGIHHPVSAQYKVLRVVRKVLPDGATKALIKLMSGY
jgi:NAD(P)-dependent dehydrogenase (short-subunit alcohol dehydrogenase family)